jgi:hypothetical protein
MYNFIKRIVYALCLLYTINIVMYNYGLVVPINIYTIFIVSATDIFGVLGIILLRYLL